MTFMPLLNRHHLLLPRQPKAINAKWAMLWRAALLESQWMMSYSSHKELMKTQAATSKRHLYWNKPEESFKYKSYCISHILIFKSIDHLHLNQALPRLLSSGLLMLGRTKAKLEQLFLRLAVPQMLPHSLHGTLLMMTTFPICL